jgi:glycosylphosphatidylinositol transamidase
LELGTDFNTYDGNVCANDESSIWVFTLVAVEAVKTYKTNPYFMLGTTQIPTWITPFVLVLFVSFLIPNTSFLGHCCGLAFGYGCKLEVPFFIFITHADCAGGLGYLKFLAPPDWALRWIEGKLNLLGRLPHYVSVDQKTYGRYGVLPTTNPTLAPPADGIALNYIGSSQRLGP